LLLPGQRRGLFEPGVENCLNRRDQKPWVDVRFVVGGFYGLVGSQMAWTLRPYVGYPGAPFELIRQFGGKLLYRHPGQRR